MTCFTDLTKNLTPHEATRLSEQVINLLDSYKSDAVEYGKLLKGLTDEVKIARANDLRAKLRHTIKKRELINHIYQPQFLGDRVDAINSILVGSNKKVNGKWNNVDSLYQQYRNRFDTFLLESVENSGLTRFLADESSWEKVELEYRHVTDSFKNSPEPAKRAAHILAELNHNLLITQQRAGSTIVKNKDFIWSQSHNKDLIMQDPDAWATRILDENYLDLDRSFGVGTTKKMAYKKLIDIAERLEDIGSGGISIINGKREFYFNEGKFVKYNKEFGYRSPLEAIQHSIKSASRKIALHEKLGPNPEKMFRELQELAQSVEPGNKKLRANIGEVWKVWRYVTGHGDGIYSNTLFQIEQTAANLDHLTKLGSASITALEDIASTIRRRTLTTGDNVIINSLDTLARSLVSLTSSKKEVSKLVNVAIDGNIRDVVDLMGAPKTLQDSFLGRINSKLYFLNRLQANISMLNATTNFMRKNAGRVLVHDLTEAIVTLKPNEFQTHSLGAAGLDSSDIKNIRKMLKVTPSKKQVDMELFEMVDFKVLELEMPLLDSIENRMIYRQRLRSKINSYYHANVNSMSPLAQGQVMSSFLFSRRLPKGHPARVALSLVNRFQSTLAQIGNNSIELARASSPDGTLNNFIAIKALATTMLTLGIGAYSTSYLKDVIKLGADEARKKREDNFEVDFAASMIGSGAGGVYAHFFASMIGANRGRPQLSSKLPSPFLDTSTQLINIMKKPDEKRFRRLLYKNFAPYQNLIYLDDEIRKEYERFFTE